MRRSTWPTMAIHGMPATGLPTILGSITPSGRIRPSPTAVPPICIWGRVAGGVNRLFRRGRGTATPAGVAVPRPRLPTKCQAFHQGDRRHPHGKLAQKLCLTLGPPYYSRYAARLRATRSAQVRLRESRRVRPAQWRLSSRYDAGAVELDSLEASVTKGRTLFGL